MSWIAIAFVLQLASTSTSAEEWTLESALRCWSPMVRPVQHVGVPGYSFQCAMLWDGSLLFGPMNPETPALQKELQSLHAPMQQVSFAFGADLEQPDRWKIGDSRVQRSLIEGRLPMPRFTFDDGALCWQEEVFAHPWNRPMDAAFDGNSSDRMLVHSLWTVSNHTPLTQTARLLVHLGDLSGVWLGYKTRMEEHWGQSLDHEWRNGLGLLEGRLRYVARPGAGEWTLRTPGPTLNDREIERCLEWKAPVDSGKTVELRLLFPYGSLPTDCAQSLLQIDALKQRDEVRTFWSSVVHAGARISTPDPFFNDYLAAVAGQMSQQIAFRRNGSLWMYKTSPNVYELYWPCNAAKALPALDFRGLRRYTEPVLGSFVATQSDEVLGLDRAGMGHGEKLAGEGFAKRHGFLGNFGEWTANPLLLSHGLEMWALARHYRITRDAQWLGSGPGSVRQALLDAFDWAVHQRTRTMRRENGELVPHWGLLPAASAHDWLAGNAVFNDVFVLFGMAEATRALSEAGDPAAPRMAQEFLDYRNRLHERTREASAGGTPEWEELQYVPRDSDESPRQWSAWNAPFVPRVIGEKDWRSIDWTYTGYSFLRAGAFGLYPPDDDLVERCLEFLEAGMPQGEGPYFDAHLRNPDGADRNWADVSDPAQPRHSLWRHYVEYETMWPVAGSLFLEKDDLPRFFEWLFHNFAVVLHPEFRVGVESLDGVPSCAPGDGERWQIVRNMFVHERGRSEPTTEPELFLLQAMPRSWLRRGARMGVTDMGTVYGGSIDVELEVGVGDGVGVSAGVSAGVDSETLTARVKWRDFAVAPERVFIRLRSGSGARLRVARVNGQPAEVLEGDRVALPAGRSGAFEIAGEY